MNALQPRLAHDPLAPGFRFLTDASAPGLLHGAVLRSAHPHAAILHIDVAQARAMPGVVVVATAQDIPGERRFGLRVADQPFLCEDRVLTVGDPVAAVAAETPAQARAALAAIAVQWQLLPVLADAAAALRPGAPALHPGGNVLHATAYRRGDAAAALATAAHIVEDVYETPRQMHGFIEPEGAVAIPGPEGLTILAPGHWPQAERDVIAGMLAIDPARLRVVASPVGGSHGGKDQLHAQPLAALLAHLSGRPVRLLWSRAESIAFGVKRHPFTIRMRSACAADGTLLAHMADLVADTGAYSQHGPEVLDTAHENAQGPYHWPHVEVTGRLVASNAGNAGAMRGFGALQVHTALEQQIDRLATACGIAPLDFRRRNLRPDASPGQLGQTLAAPSWASRAAQRLRPPAPPRQEGRWLIGAGIALVEKGEGFARGGPNHAAIALALTPSGRIAVQLGMSDLGQGLHEAAAVLAARRLGCAPQDVDVLLADTAGTPDSGPMAASRGTGIAHRAIAAAAPAFLGALLDRAATRLGQPPAALRLGPGGVWAVDARANAPLLPFVALAESGPLGVLADAPPIETSSGTGAVHAVFTACAAEAVVAVDRLTGRVVVRRMRLIPVSGEVASRAGLRAQLEGGASIAAGFVSLEDLPSPGGHMRAANLDGYLMPTIADAFPVAVDAVEDIPPDILGPRGVGEIGINASAPALCNAIRAATGFVCRRLPVDPAAMLAHLDAAG
jgi:CO/xanthine dehydrogenase Mo-binding subunit